MAFTPSPEGEWVKYGWIVFFVVIGLALLGLI